MFLRIKIFTFRTNRLGTNFLSASKYKVENNIKILANGMKIKEKIVEERKLNFPTYTVFHDFTIFLSTQ